MPILADNTMNLRQSVIEEIREQQQPILEFAGKAEQFDQRVTTVEDDVALVSPGTPSGPSEFAANVAGQTVWVKLDRISPTMGAYGADPTGATDSTDAFQQALDDAAAAGAVLHVEPGEYLITDDLIVPNGAVVESRGSDQTIISRTTPGDPIAASGIFNAHGSLGPYISLSASASEGATSVTVATNPNLSPGDYVYLRSDRLPWGGSATPDHDIQIVNSVTGTGPYTVHFTAGLTRAFNTVDNACLAKMTTTTAKIHGFTLAFPGAPAATNGIDLYYAGPGTEVGDIVIDGWSDRGIHVFAGYGVLGDRLRFTNPSDIGSGKGYGVVLHYGAKRCDFGHIEGLNTRHTVDIGRGSSFNLIHDGVGYKRHTDVDQDFGCHGLDARWNTFRNLETHGQSTGFGCGNNSYGGDLGTVFELCRAFGQGQGTINHFEARNGSRETKFVNVESHGGRSGIGARGDDTMVLNPLIENWTSNTGISFYDTIGGMVSGGTLRNGSIGIHSSAGSNYLRVLDVATVNVTTPTALNATGTNNVVRVTSR